MTKWPIQKQTLSTVQNTQKNKTLQQKFSIFFISYYLFIKITKTINDLINIKLQMAVFCIQMTPLLNVHANKSSCLVPLSNQYHENFLPWKCLIKSCIFNSFKYIYILLFIYSQMPIKRPPKGLPKCGLLMGRPLNRTCLRNLSDVVFVVWHLSRV